MSPQKIRSMNTKTLSKHLADLGLPVGESLEDNRRTLFQAIYTLYGANGPIPWSKVSSIPGIYRVSLVSDSGYYGTMELSKIIKLYE